MWCVRLGPGPSATSVPAALRLALEHHSTVTRARSRDLRAGLNTPLNGLFRISSHPPVPESLPSPNPGWAE
ncbi:hypothetical protein NDU88_006874 [Pleurodeles waltl]|uniref:Uncharacterized protein n=1 Tax=Pleurodeles waltl TaxID=8319 RepID=A0AAV7PJL8_PLEWA|nr:hypothetical protein NDU88_006874 [Pleurodeles waltl]